MPVPDTYRAIPLALNKISEMFLAQRKSDVESSDDQQATMDLNERGLYCCYPTRLLTPASHSCLPGQSSKIRKKGKNDRRPSATQCVAADRDG